MSEEPIEEALVRPSKSFSIIWLLPLIAVAIGAWLLYKSLAEAPIEIKIDFPTGTGIEIGKTKVIYEGINAGVVKDIQLDKTDLKGVVVTVEMNNRMEPLLRANTQFWLVKPEISLSGVTGLETIVSGNYIGVKPSMSGAPSHYFKALSEAPAVDMSAPGLHLNLIARDLGAVYEGAPLLYKKIVVGEVLDYDLDAAHDRVIISVLVRPPYDKLITDRTRFWNSGGIRFHAGLDGVDVHMDSLLTVLKGGITFDAGAGDGATPANNGDQFKLYEDYASAQRAVSATIEFAADGNFATKGSKILYKGFAVGEVNAVHLSDDRRKVIETVSFNPEITDALTTGTRFWLVKPRISLQGVSGLDALLKGSYIAMDTGGGKPTRTFVALSKAPSLDTNKPGLHLKLEASDLGSLSVGSPVLYRRIPVGAVEGFSLSAKHDSVLVDVLIEPRYSKLVRTTSRFWNASGVSLSGSLSGVKLRTESLASIIQGGVAFFNLPDHQGQPGKNGSVYNLYPDRTSAAESGLLVDIWLPSAEGVDAGTSIRYQGIEIGKVKQVKLNPNLNGVTVQALLQLHPERFARTGSVFWLVQPKLSITGVANLETLVTGKYFDVQPGTGAPTRHFSGQLQAPIESLRQGLNIVLMSSSLGSIREGQRIYYREVPVGKITGYGLGDNADEVKIFANIESRYAVLVRKGSEFWNISGFNIDVGLFKGAKIKADSLESILAGGIAFATPDNGTSLPRVKDGAVFSLHGQSKQNWLTWKPKIPLQH